MEELPAPFAEAGEERPVEAEGRADALDIGGRRLVAGDHRRRIARCDIEQAEHEQRDHRHHRDGREDAPDDIGHHGGMIAGFETSAMSSGLRYSAWTKLMSMMSSVFYVGFQNASLADP
jgi:hypothetical protein